MNWPELLQTIFTIVLVPLLGILTKYLVSLITIKISEAQSKTNDETTKKYLELLRQTITDCVVATNQTYVDSLKDKDAFTAEAQKEAFQKTYASVMSILTDDAKVYLQNFLGDLDGYVSNLIESNVKIEKVMA